MTSEVTQADRDAAAEWLWDPESVSWDRRDFDKMKSGSWDDHSLIQAFARHRLTAQSGEGRSGAGEREAATCANNARVGREGEQLRKALSHRGSMSVVAGGGQKPFVKITFGSLALAYAASDALHAALNARQSGEGERGQ